MSEVERPIPVLENPPNIDELNRLGGYTELTKAWEIFYTDRPEARRVETSLVPPPWTPLYAQPFKFVKNEDLEELLRRWTIQVNALIGPPTQ